MLGSVIESALRVPQTYRGKQAFPSFSILPKLQQGWILSVMDSLLHYLDLAGTVVFGITGCLVAARKKSDLVGFILLAMVTGTGGGTFRDMILDRTPVFWVGQPDYLYLCAATAGIMFLVARRVEQWRQLLLWLDAIGLAVFAVIGCSVAQQMGAPAAVCWLMGVMTATFGGIIRDLLADEPTLVMRKEIYASAAFVGAVVFWYSQNIWLGVIVGFAIRAAAIHFRLTLPGYGNELGAEELRRKWDRP